MNEPLRPLSLGEILDRPAQLYRSRFIVYLGIAMVPAMAEFVPIYIVCSVVTWSNKIRLPFVSAATGFTLYRFFIIAMVMATPLIWLGALSMATAAMNHAASHHYLGETVTIRDSYKTIWQHRWHYTRLYLLLALFVGAIPLAAWFLRLPLASFIATLASKAGLGGSEGSFLVSVMAFLLIVVLAGYVIWLSVHLSLAFPACVVEQSGAWQAFKRSWTLSKGTKGRIFFLFLLVGILGLVLWAGVGFFVVTLEAMFLKTLLQHMNIVVVFTLFYTCGLPVAAQALINPIQNIALTLFYYDQRVRKEGYDIERMIEAAGMNATITTTAESKVIQA
jgi:hypothetical protein